MAYNTKSLKKDLDNKPVPQIFDAVKDDYEVIQGRNGAPRTEIYGPDGNPISTTAGKLDVRASEIEAILNTLLTKAGFDAKNDLSVTALRDAIRGAGSKTLSDIATALAPLATSAKQDTLIAKDFATQTTLASILAKIIATPATEAKQDALITKDFATQTTLAAVLAKLSSDPATQATLAAVLAALQSTLSVTLTGSTVEIGGVSFPVSGGDTLRGKSADKPDAADAYAVIPYCFYLSVDIGVVEVTNGTNWVVM